MRLRFRSAAGLALGLTVIVCLGRAQTTGTIEGLVLDPSPAPVGGASVTLVEVATNATRSTRTDGEGRYVAPGLPPGLYRVEVAAAGFRTAQRRDLALSAGRTLRVDFELQLGEVRETVVVEGLPALVHTSAADWGGTIGRPQLDALPLNGRDIFDLAAQQPGVSVATHAEGAIFNGMGIQVSVNGNRPNQNSFRMDGVSLNDASGSAPASAAGRLLGVEGIQELRLITNPFSAEYGKAAGGVLTAVSRSGTNELHGSLYHYLRNSALDARNFFDSRSEPIPPLRRNQFGVLLAGPVRRDRVFFLANFEGIRESLTRTQRAVTLNADARQGLLPSGRVAVNPAVRPYLALYPMPNGRDFGDGTAEFISQARTANTENFGFGRTDVIFSDRLRSAFHFTMDRGDNSNPDAFLIWTLRKDSRFRFLRSSTEFVQSPRTLHFFRLGYSNVHNNEDGEAPGVPRELSFVPGRPIGQIQVTGLTEITDRTVGALPRFQTLGDYQFNYEAFHTQGRHNLRFGAGYDRLSFRQRGDFQANGRYVFTSVANFLRGIARSGDLMSPESDTRRLWRQHQYYFFFQDEWAPFPNLNLSAGVRYEGYTSPTEAAGKIATLPNPLQDTAMRIGGPLFRNPSAWNFAPRLALSWSPFPSRRTVIRAGAGMFFDLLTSREVTIAGMRVPPFFNRLFPTAPAFPNLLEAARAAAPDRSLDGIAYAMEQPYVLQFRFAVEQQIGAGTAIEVGYAGSRGIHLIGQYGDLNIARPQVLADGRMYFAPEAPLRNPAFSRIGLRSSEFNSVYHALLVGVRRRFSSRVGLEANYTWGKAIDDSSSSVNTEFDNSDRHPFPTNNRLQRGLADFDVRHTFTANLAWRLPGLERGAWRHALGGWEVHALAQCQTGFPFNPRIGFDRARLRSGWGDLDQRPSLAPEASSRIVLGDPARYFDPAAFLLPEAGFYGNLGRNTITGPGLFAVNLGIHKAIWRAERHQLTWRGELFNVTNHPNFDLPTGLSLFSSTGARVGSAGQITSTATSSRQVQLALRWTF